MYKFNTIFTRFLIKNIVDCLQAKLKKAHKVIKTKEGIIMVKLFEGRDGEMDIEAKRMFGLGYAGFFANPNNHKIKSKVSEISNMQKILENPDDIDLSNISLRS